MAILKLHLLDSPTLFRKTSKVHFFDKSLRNMVDDMVDTMDEFGGVGLAATQVGIPYNIVVIASFLNDSEHPLILINPKVVKQSGDRIVSEGCLSIPERFGKTHRPEKITVDYQDINGSFQRIKADNDLMAQVLSHEIEHLFGILYVRHMAVGEDAKDTSDK